MALAGHKLFETVLIANRGEIAVRIARTLRRLGVRSVAVYSDADADGVHPRAADLAVRIGPAKASESYLNVAAILGAAQRTGAEAVHPGYGFLSESLELAQGCADAGLVFIGPDLRSLEVMGSKILAKEHVSAAGVPVIAGAAEPDGAASDDRDADLVKAAAGVGFPLLVKPSAGGGGKGMQVVGDLADLPEALAAARRVARSAFGDDRLLLERFIEAPRHIEVQVLADSAGTVVSLGERECSLQRRHQKVIEEAPSPLLADDTRERICGAARDVARSVNYRGAGTVEFLVPAADPEAFAFIEMNTRLQVEHPVTELVTGVDLVEWQVRIAASQLLDSAVTTYTRQGHAIEARVYAERPADGFLPAMGTAPVVDWPTEVRVDHAFAAGSTVGPDYDPMLAKVIAHGATREEAIARLDRALAETAILGVHTNVDYLRVLLACPEVLAGAADTTFLDQVDYSEPEIDPHALIAAALVRHQQAWPDSADLWHQPSGWRLGSAEPVVYTFAAAHGRYRGLVTGSPGDAMLEVFAETVEGPEQIAALPAGLVSNGANQVLRLDGLGLPVTMYSADVTWVRLEGRTTALTPMPRHTLGELADDSTGADPQLRTPTPGIVVAVHAESGAEVAQGDLAVTVEAMKMEHHIRASTSGTIRIDVAVGDVVRADQVVGLITGTSPSQEN